MIQSYIDKFVALLLQSTPEQWVFAFIVLMVTDIAWARYTVATHNSSNPHQAAGWALLLFVLGGSAVVTYTTNPVLLLPAGAGAYAGTFLGVRMKKSTNGS